MLPIILLLSGLRQLTEEAVNEVTADMLRHYVERSTFCLLRIQFITGNFVNVK